MTWKAPLPHLQSDQAKEVYLSEKKNQQEEEDYLAKMMKAQKDLMKNRESKLPILNKISEKHSIIDVLLKIVIFIVGQQHVALVQQQLVIKKQVMNKQTLLIFWRWKQVMVKLRLNQK